MIKIENIRAGSVVRLRPDFGTGTPVKVAVIEVEEDIKNGRAGIVYDGRWAYLSQVDAVISY